MNCAAGLCCITDRGDECNFSGVQSTWAELFHVFPELRVKSDFIEHCMYAS
jgi:hypothetical protein